MLLAVFFMGSLLLGWFRSSTTVAAINMTFVVTTAADSGPGSLRQAITDSNAAVTTSANPNAISFTIPGAGVHTIALQTPLPQITQPTIIDGTTQPGTSCGNLVADAPFGADSAHTLLIEIVSATQVTGGTYQHTLNFASGTDKSAIKGLVLNGTVTADSSDINTFARNMTIDCTYIGVKPDGVTPFPVTAVNLSIQGNNPDNLTVSNSLFASLRTDGASTDKTDGVVFKNNRVGVSVTGTKLWTSPGLFLSYFSNLTIGGSLADANMFGGGIGIYWSDHIAIKGNYVGITTDNQVLGNTGPGIAAYAGISDMVVGGSTPDERNVISGNGKEGVVAAGTNIAVKGNYIGVGVDGTTRAANLRGVSTGGTNFIIGGSTAGERNIISGNNDIGIIVDAGTTGDNNIIGNYVGLDAAGNVMSNNTTGIKSSGSNITIGGSQAGEGNVISGNNGSAIEAGNPDGGYLNIYGNIIGLKPDGETVAGNKGGVLDLSAKGPAHIGGPNTGEGNIMSGNNGGIFVRDANSQTYIQANKIGLTKSGHVVGNTSYWGIASWDNGFLRDFTIGGATAQEGNTIAGVSGNGGAIGLINATNATASHNTLHNNQSPGIRVEGSSANNNHITDNIIRDNTGSGVLVRMEGSINTVGNTISHNSIYNNGAIGIDLSNTDWWLAPDGITANDPLDADTGPNGLQNYPVITASMTRCDGSVDTKNTPMFNSTPNTTFTIDYYANPSWNPSSTIPRQGEQWVTSETVTTDAGGNATLNLTLINSITYPSVTATAPDGSTSEFGSINTVAFTQCQDMLQRVVATTTNDITLSATWTGSHVPTTYLRNQPQFPTDYNSTTGQYTDRIEQAGMTVTVTVGGQNLIWQDHPSIYSSSYALDDNGWSVAGHTATPLPEGTYDVVLTVTDPITKLSMSRTYPGAVKVALPRVSYTTTFTNNSTPTLSGTASGVAQDSGGLYTAYILPKGSAAPNPNLLSSDPAYVAPRVLQYVADTTKDAAGNTIIADTGAFKVLTNKQAIINAWTAYHDEQLANWAVGGVPEWNYFSNKVHSLKVTNTGGVDWSTIKSVQDIKGTCTNTEVQQAFYNWGWATAATQASCEAGIQAAYDADKSWYDQYLQTNIDNLSSATPDYDTSPLPQGTYDVYILGYDVSSNSFQKDFPGGLVVDFTTPTVTLVTTAAKDNVSPQLNGSVSDPTAAVTVTLTGPNGTTYGPFTAKNNGDGTWTLPAGAIQPGLLLGTYTVAVTVTSLSGNHSTETKTLVLTASTKPTTLSKTGSDYIYVLSISGVVLGVGALWLVGQRRRTEKRLRYVRS